MYLLATINGHIVRVTEADFDRGWVYLTYIENETLETKTLKKESLDSSTILATNVIIENDSRLPLNIEGSLNGNSVHLINISIYENFAYFIYVQDSYLRSVRKFILEYDTILLLDSIFQTSGTGIGTGGDSWVSGTGTKGVIPVWGDNNTLGDSTISYSDGTYSIPEDNNAVIEGSLGVGISPKYAFHISRNTTSPNDALAPIIKVENTSPTRGDFYSTPNYAQFLAAAGNGTVLGRFMAAYNTTFITDGIWIGAATDHPVNFVQNEQTRLRINTTGQTDIGYGLRVGSIGGADVSANNLLVEGDITGQGFIQCTPTAADAIIQAIAGSDHDSYFKLGCGSVIWDLYHDHSSHNFCIGYNGEERLRITPLGQTDILYGLRVGSIGGADVGANNAVIEGSLTVGTLTGLLKATNGLLSVATAETDYLTGSLTNDYVPLAKTAGLLVNSVLHQVGSRIGIGVSPIYDFHLEKSVDDCVAVYARNSNGGALALAALAVVNDVGGAMDMVSFGSNYSGNGFGGITNANLQLLYGNSTAGLLIENYVNGPLYLGTNNVANVKLNTSGQLDVLYGLRVGSLGGDDVGENNLVVEGNVSANGICIRGVQSVGAGGTGADPKIISNLSTYPRVNITPTDDAQCYSLSTSGVPDGSICIVSNISTDWYYIYLGSYQFGQNQSKMFIFTNSAWSGIG